MNNSPTLLNYNLISNRKTWLHANGIQMEQTSDLVYEGKLIGETTYTQRAHRYSELDLGIAKIDYYDPKDKVVHEVKKSNKMEGAHEWQVKYYLYLMEQAGIFGASGILEYPKLRQTHEVFLTETDRAYLEEVLPKISKLVKQNDCPPRLDKKSICRRCSYFDFCWSGEEGQ